MVNLKIDVDELGVDPDAMFDREPYMVSLKTDDGRLDFAYVIVHVTWGKKVGPRIAEVRALYHYYEMVLAKEKDVVIVGDFNRNVGDSKSLGWLKEQVGLTELWHSPRANRHPGREAGILTREAKHSDRAPIWERRLCLLLREGPVAGLRVGSGRSALLFS